MDSATITGIRRTYYIKKDFQKRFIIAYVALLFLGILLANTILYALLNKEIDKAFYRAHIGITTTGDVVRSPLILTSVTIFLISIGATVTATLFHSRKTDSLLHCLSEGMQGLKNGDLTVRINLCKDNLTEVSDIFNMAVQKLNRKVSNITDEMAILDEAISRVREDKNVNLEEVIRRADSLERYISGLKLRQ